MKTIEQQIEETDVEQILSLFPNAPYSAYTYQCAIYRLCAEQIRSYSHPFIVKASVSAGKTTMISMLMHRVQQLGMPAMVLSRQGEIVEQDAAEMWAWSVKNSVFSASLGAKSVSFPIITASEKTAVNALMMQLNDYAPLVMLIDECQHVDVDDLLNSQERIVRKIQTITDSVTGEQVDQEIEYKGETYDDMIEAKRTGYTILIRTLQERCRRVHKREMRIIGLTGTDYRGVQPIINEDLETPGFWRFAVCDVSTDYLVRFGAVVPTVFGDTGDLHYELDQFKSDGNEGTQDISAEKMRAMQKHISTQGTKTQEIMRDVYERTKNRNSVLITCSGKRHCEEAAAALPPGTTYCIITDSLGKKQRRQYLKDVYDGKIKFTFQVGCLTTGVNIPIWDTNVILRKIGSLTLLVQLIGRTMRKLKKEQIAAGIVKHDAMVLDYSETMLEMGELYHNPMIDQYHFEMAKVSGEWKTCQICRANGKTGKNSEHARRCITENVINPLRVSPVRPGWSVLKTPRPARLPIKTERCEYFWKSRRCEDVYDNEKRLIKRGCGTENDIVARFCRKCSGTLLDYNENLSSKHYVENDFYDVIYFTITPTKNQTSLLFKYTLQNRENGHSFVATEMYSPATDNQGIRAKWREACRQHIANPEMARKIGQLNNALNIMSYVQEFRSPQQATHRKGKGGRDNLHKKVFADEVG